MATREEVSETLLTRINMAAENTTNATNLLKLAEAYAWASYPNQPHGGQVVSK